MAPNDLNDIGIDLRLFDVSYELRALKDHLGLVEQEIMRIRNEEEDRLHASLKREGLSPNDDDWDIFRQEFYEKTEFLLPRFLRVPFLVALYAVYESAVIEVSRKMQRKLSQAISIDDLRGDFLERAKKYYEHILRFKLCTRPRHWERITMLSELRNAIAHANGRVEMLNPGVQKKISKWEKQKLGLSMDYGYIIIDAKLAKNLLESVQSSLTDLVDRFKKWDDEHRSV